MNTRQRIRFREIAKYCRINKASKHGQLAESEHDTIEHSIMKLKALRLAKKKGYPCWTEVPIWCNGEKAIADFLFINRDGKAMVIEFETNKTEKTIKKKLHQYRWNWIAEVFIIDVPTKDEIFDYDLSNCIV